MRKIVWTVTAVVFALPLVLGPLPIMSGQTLPKKLPIKKIVDIEMSEIFLDECRVWVRVKNKGTVKIDAALREKVWVDGVLKDDSRTHYVLAPGGVFAHGVGADPGLKISGKMRKIRAEIDVDNVLTNDANKANNVKEVTRGCIE